ncbi:MAG: heavy metal-binding domain-containing protein [Saprospiraceae bacterium]
MKNMLIAGFALVLSALSFSACNNDHPKHNAQPAAPGTKYICPMNCEKGKTYDQPGSCPVCHMDLEPMKADEQANKAEYFTAFSANPAQLEAGKPAMLSFTPKIKGNESAPVPLDLVHEKKMHLILVSDDLSWFDHIHPEFAATGSYDIKVLAKGESFAKGRGHNETRFDNGGKYWAFTDFKPTGGLNQVNKTEFAVAGVPAKTVAYTQPKMTTSVDGYSITFDPHGSAIAAGAPAHLHIDITEKGKRITPDNIENYLGAKAHVVMIETTTKEFVHVHPEAVGDELEMNTTFAKPGTYRGWLQFQTNGVVHAAGFVLKVEAGAAEQEGHGH